MTNQTNLVSFIPMENTTMEKNNQTDAFERSYSRADLIKFCDLTRGQSEIWTNRGIISTTKEAGSGNHRQYSFFNLVEGKIAKRLSEGFGMAASDISDILEGFRVWLTDLGYMKANMENFFMSDFVLVIHQKGTAPRTDMYHGGLPDDFFLPFAVVISIGMVANELLDQILKDENSNNWWGNAFYERRARKMGLIDQLAMFPVLTRNKPDPMHPGALNG